ncbi:MAG TPA: AIM24 family protein, partial [Silvibacterium sp.]|nr:AIM24 family protein [Silvibacterium sp.]
MPSLLVCDCSDCGCICRHILCLFWAFGELAHGLWRWTYTLVWNYGSPSARIYSKEFAMQSNVIGTTMPVLEFILEPNEAIVSEAGELSWMGASIQMTTHTQMAGGGGFFGAIRRVAGGGSLFMTEYRALG